MAAIMRRTCMGVTSTWPCPIDMLTVSPAVHDIGFPFFDILGCGMSPGLSLPNSDAGDGAEAEGVRPLGDGRRADLEAGVCRSRRRRIRGSPS